MRQSKAESPVKSSQVLSLHPVLHHALANLDVQLEEELARYRRQRLGGARPLQPAGRRSTPKTLDLISVSPNGGQRQASPTHSTPTRAEEFSSVTPVTQAPVTQGTLAQETVAQSTVLQNAVVQNAAVQEASPWDSLEHPKVPAVTPPPPPRPSGPDVLGNQLSSELAIAAAPHDRDELDDLLAGNAEAENALQAKSGVALEDYLESSEELLRSLAEEEAKVQAERGFMQSLLTPLGVGSMLLLLLSSAMFGYVVMNPSGLSRMFASRDASPANEATGSATDGATNGGTDPQGTSSQASPAQGTTVAPQPNLAAKEFKDLNLSTLGTLKPGNTTALNALSKSALPTVKPSAAATAIPGNPAVPTAPTGQQPQSTASVQSAAPAPAVQSVPIHPSRSSASSSASTRTSTRTYVAPEPPRYQAPPAPRQVAPSQSYVPPVQRSTAPPPSAPAPAPSHNAANYPYKVEINFEGDRTLNETRKVVPDAYLQNLPDGAKVQAGAFSSEADAAARVQELQKQGIPAEVRKR